MEIIVQQRSKKMQQSHYTNFINDNNFMTDSLKIRCYQNFDGAPGPIFKDDWPIIVVSIYSSLLLISLKDGHLRIRLDKYDSSMTIRQYQAITNLDYCS